MDEYVIRRHDNLFICRDREMAEKITRMQRIDYYEILKECYGMRIGELGIAMRFIRNNTVYDMKDLEKNIHIHYRLRIFRNINRIRREYDKEYLELLKKGYVPFVGLTDDDVLHAPYYRRFNYARRHGGCGIYPLSHDGYLFYICDLGDTYYLRMTAENSEGFIILPKKRIDISDLNLMNKDVMENIRLLGIIVNKLRLDDCDHEACELLREYGAMGLFID